MTALQISLGLSVAAVISNAAWSKLESLSGSDMILKKLFGHESPSPKIGRPYGLERSPTYGPGQSFESSPINPRQSGLNCGPP